MNTKAIAFLLAWVSYGVGSYGIVLIRGWNIPPRQWFSPLTPYAWPSDGSAPMCIPPSQIFPASDGSGGVPCTGNSGAAAKGTTYQQSVTTPGPGAISQFIGPEGGNPIQQTGGTVAGGHGR